MMNCATYCVKSKGLRPMTPNDAINLLRSTLQTLHSVRSQLDLEVRDNPNLEATYTELQILDNTLSSNIQEATTILDMVWRNQGYNKKPGTLLRQIRRVLGFTYP
jgi:hypothetical protein